MAFLDYILGRPLSSDEDKDERVGPLAGISVFGLDALSSAAYGPEAALTVLMGLGAASVAYSVPITGAVCVILILVYFSYRQTIAAYPQGAGSYTVARENLGPTAGVFAAAALLIDYTLNVAVGISAGVGALVSAFPVLQSQTLLLCLCILALLTYMNLRGVREAGLAFMPPTYLFIGCLAVVICIGLVRATVSGGHPAPIVMPPAAPQGGERASWWLLLKAFAAGCTAMTGVEAVSNGVQAFKEPLVNAARQTLTMIVVILIFLLVGIAFLIPAYNIVATQPGSPNYQSVLSIITQAIVGRGPFYYVVLASILLVVCLSANTSFADFPRVCRTIAGDGYLPYSFTVRGRRLVYTEGIVVLTVLSGSLLIFFGGVTDKLIPLFAIGAFLAFTLSQAGMVVHRLKAKESRDFLGAATNGIGAIATGITFVIVLVTKFHEGAWLVVIVLPAFCLMMFGIRRHYTKVSKEIAISGPVSLTKPHQVIAIVVIQNLNSVAQKALQMAFELSKTIHVLHIQEESADRDFVKDWKTDAEPSIRGAGLPEPQVVILKSPYRKVISPILDYIWGVEKEHPYNSIAVIIPQLIEKHWYYNFLHNQRAALLSSILLFKGKSRVVIVNVPWNLRSHEKDRSMRT
ncbi:MAG: APC family permease [Verrucomicrobia bacterium]|nr:APC family permease [Verrucomicrobiota bacterium]